MFYHAHGRPGAAVNTRARPEPARPIAGLVGIARVGADAHGVMDWPYLPVCTALAFTNPGEDASSHPFLFHTPSPGMSKSVTVCAGRITGYAGLRIRASLPVGVKQIRPALR